MAYTSRATSAGFRFLHWSKLGTDGRAIGTGSTRPTAGNTTGAGFARLRGALTLPSGTPEDTVVDVPGDDDDSLAAFNFPSGQSARGTLELSYADMDFDAYVQALTVENPTNTDWGFVPMQARDRGSNPIALIAQRKAIKGDPNNTGNKAWEIRYLLNTKVTPQDNPMQSRANSPYQYSITTTKSTIKPWGATFTESANNTTAAGGYKTYSDNPIAQQVYTGNNSQQVFTLPYAVVATTKILVAVNYYPQTYTTDYTVSGTTLTFVGTPANNADIQVIWEVAEEDLE